VRGCLSLDLPSEHLSPFSREDVSSRFAPLKRTYPYRIGFQNWFLVPCFFSLCNPWNCMSGRILLGAGLCGQAFVFSAQPEDLDRGDFSSRSGWRAVVAFFYLFFFPRCPFGSSSMTHLLFFHDLSGVFRRSESTGIKAGFNSPSRVVLRSAVFFYQNIGIYYRVAPAPISLDLCVPTLFPRFFSFNGYPGHFRVALD